MCSVIHQCLVQALRGVGVLATVAALALAIAVVPNHAMAQVTPDTTQQEPATPGREAETAADDDTTLSAQAQNLAQFLGGRLDVVALLTAIGGLVTAMTSLVSVRNNRVMIEAQLWPDFNRRYKTDDMSQAIKALTNWYYDHPADFVELWLEKLRQGDAEGKQLDLHRRTLSMFFIDIASLYKDRIISKRFARFVANQAGLNVFYEVVVPMNMSQRPARTREAVRYLKKLLKQVEGGMFDPRKHGR